MSRLISGKLGKVELGALLFGFISFLVVCLALSLSNTSFLKHAAQAQSASVETDRADYSAGDMAEIFGSGWQPGEAVMLEIVGDPAMDPDAPPDSFSALADSNGDISFQYLIPGHDFDQTFTLTATGMGSSASTTFTNNLNSASLPAPEMPSSPMATVMTDQPDYYPTQVVQISGSGWDPGETVELYLVGDPLTHDPETIYTTADESGNISAQYVVQDYDLNRSFTLTATGMTSGLTAVTTFTDAIGFKILGADNFQHEKSGPSPATDEEDLGSFVQGNSVSLTCPRGNGLTAQGTGLGSDGTTNWTLAYGTVRTDNTTLSPLTTLTPSSGTFTGNSVGNVTESCVAVTITTGSLTVGTTYHGQLRITGTNTTSFADYFFKFTVTAPAATCGNSIVETGEQCDDGNTSNGDCCSATCQTEPADTVCRPSDGQCDVAETCGGASTCPADGFASDTTTCTGTSNGDVCDDVDKCSGTANTCVDKFKPSSVECRADAGQCDVPESCTGTSGACPADQFEPATTLCTGTSQGDVCDNDTADHCTGADNSCVDVFWDYYFGGFDQPVDNPMTLNIGQAGRTYPVKWTLHSCNGGPDICDPSEVYPNPPKYKEIMCPGGNPPMDLMETTSDMSGGSSLRCADGKLIFNWQTSKSFAGKCYMWILDLKHGADAYALFQFKK
jgi:cysteine-rich repeat protein